MPKLPKFPIHLKIAYTVSDNEYGLIADIWSKVGVLWGGLMYPKHLAKPFSSYLLKGEHQSFQMRYNMTANFDGPQFCSPLTYKVMKYLIGKLWSPPLGSQPEKGLEGCLGYIRPPQSTPTLLHISAIVCSLNFIAVYLIWKLSCPPLGS